MFYSLSNVLVKIPLFVAQVGVLYQLISNGIKKGENKIYLFAKSFVFVLLVTQVLHFCSYTLIQLIQSWLPAKTHGFVEKMLGENIQNILIYLIFVVTKMYHERRNKQRFIRISLISCIFAVVQIVFYYYLFLSNPEGLTNHIIGIVTICSLVVLFVHGAMLELMERIVENQKKQSDEEKKLMEKKYEYDYYLLAEEQEAMIRKIHRDMGVQIEQVQRLLQEKDVDKRKEAEVLLGKMEEEVSKVGRVYYCSDVVLNTILSLKQERARKHGLEMDIKVDSVAETRMEDIDLCSVATNLLDNAIEAAEKVKEAKAKEAESDMAIRVRIGQRGGYLVLRVDNPSIIPPKKNKKGYFISTKKEVSGIKEHGRGIRIVEKTLEKYAGSLSWKEENGYVTVAAFIPVKEGEA